MTTPDRTNHPETTEPGLTKNIEAPPSCSSASPTFSLDSGGG
jgi:hypothetical protein